jgi:hypothetical protein
MVLTFGIWSDFGKRYAVLSTSFHVVQPQFEHQAMATMGPETSPRQDLLDGLSRMCSESLRIKRGGFPVSTSARNVSNCAVFFALARRISVEQVNSKGE